MGDAHQGIVHIIGPELGLTQPGMTIVCGDSHTSTHGAFGALAFGIGTSEVEHVLATQTLPQQRPQTMAVNVEGDLPAGVSAKDLILAIIGAIGTGGGMGHVIEYRGAAIRALTHGRPDDGLQHVHRGRSPGRHGRPRRRHVRVPRGPPVQPARNSSGRRRWRTGGRSATDQGARFDREVTIDAGCPDAVRLLGHQPGPGRPDRRRGARPGRVSRTPPAREAAARALTYMGLAAGTAVRDIPVDTVFIGSCTNGRIEDLRAAAAVLRGPAGGAVGPGPGRPGIRAGEDCRPRPKGWTGSSSPAGFEWRNPGCSMCLAMNPDKLAPGERSASTSNRNFEGRQGRGGRTHLVSPAVAAATAVAGHFAAPADLDEGRTADGSRFGWCPAPRSPSTAPMSTPTRSSRATG